MSTQCQLRQERPSLVDRFLLGTGRTAQSRHVLVMVRHTELVRFNQHLIRVRGRGYVLG